LLIGGKLPLHFRAFAVQAVNLGLHILDLAGDDLVGPAVLIESCKTENCRGHAARKQQDR